MDPITNYCVIVSPDIDNFIQEVNDAVKEGWQPLGGLVITVIDGRVTYHQSMVETDSDRL